MRAQQRNYTCGLAAVANALECLGIKRTQQQIGKLCYSDPMNGTSEIEIQRALLACGAHVDEWEHKQAPRSWDWLFTRLFAGQPVILCVDDFQHWVTAVGLLGQSVIVFDPALGAGLRIYQKKGLLTRWRLGSGGPSFYGFAVSR